MRLTKERIKNFKEKEEVKAVKGTKIGCFDNDSLSEISIKDLFEIDKIEEAIKAQNIEEGEELQIKGNIKAVIKKLDKRELGWKPKD